MSFFIHSSPENALLFCECENPVKEFSFFDREKNPVQPSPLSVRSLENGTFQYIFSSANLKEWSPETPELYYLSADSGALIPFGIVSLKTVGNKMVLVNGEEYFFRGYIRGIVAHDHPNMSGKSKYESYLYHISQAKKYGFNLVRFHSTIPDEDFVRAADELGLFIHMEIGFSYHYDENGKKGGLLVDNENWRNTIRKFRNHPSVAIFCIGNEMHSSGHVPEVMQLYREGKRLAPSKLIMDNSGWGEFDRTSADIFSQHIAYYYPYMHHRDMFITDKCWHLNGSAFDTPLKVSNKDAETERNATPVKPVLAHEAIHYIEIPDYEKLNRKFDEFAEKAGKDYLLKNDISKPRYLTELPELIRKKGLEPKMKDYRLASQKFKMTGMKTYLERLRNSQLCGFEMLQFADCLKYENKNGIVDFFDDDKFIPHEWMLQFNGEDSLLCDLPEECFYGNTELKVPILFSRFSKPEVLRGTLHIFIKQDQNIRDLYSGENISAVKGLQKLADVTFRLPEVKNPEKWELCAEFISENYRVANSWELRVYPKPSVLKKFQQRFVNSDMEQFLKEYTAASAKSSDVTVTDTLDQNLFNDLENGKTVVLFYHRDKINQEGFYLPGSLDRCKPCIWDRGSHLGAIAYADFVQKSLACERYCGNEIFHLCNGGYKLNLDHFPCQVTELFSCVDKPVRDRMKGLVHKIKEFQVDDTLRNFCYLGALNVGNGTLIFSTVSTEKYQSPECANYFAGLLNHVEYIQPETGTDLKTFFRYVTESPVNKEDVMNHFWEIDNKPVEDTLFWEATGIDLSKIK